MRVIPVPCLSDNYAYVVLSSTDPSTALVIDGVTPINVTQAIPPTATLQAILTTHHHYDHAGGNKDLHDQFPHLPIYGGCDRVQARTHGVQHNDTFTVGPLVVHVIGTPCHTRSSVSYLIHETGDTTNQALFTGDTLFIGGCGRFFEGTAQEMLTALTRLAHLDKEVKVYCGHEYTVSNLLFAQSVDPENAELKDKLRWAQSVSCTVPSTIGQELAFNPFMRVNEEALKVATGESDPVRVMDTLRNMKNSFKG